MIVFLFKGVRKELKIQPVIHATNSDYFHNLTGNKKETCMWNEDIDKIPPNTVLKKAIYCQSCVITLLLAMSFNCLILCNVLLLSIN